MTGRGKGLARRSRFKRQRPNPVPLIDRSQVLEGLPVEAPWSHSLEAAQAPALGIQMKTVDQSACCGRCSKAADIKLILLDVSPAPKTFPINKTLFDLTLEAPLGWIVECQPSANLIRKIVLA